MAGPTGRLLINSDAASQEVGGGSAFRAMLGNIDINFKQIEDRVWPPPQVIPPAVPPGVPGLRLSAQSGVPISSSDQLSVTTLFGVPAGFNAAGLWDGTNWVARLIETDLILPLTGSAASSQYSVWLYWDTTAVPPALKLGRGAAWLSAVGPSEATESFQGRTVNLNPLTFGAVVVPPRQALLIGGFATTSAGAFTEDSVSKRLVSNLYNATPRAMRRIDNSVTAWECPADGEGGTGTGTWHYVNEGAGNGKELNRLEFFSINGAHPVTAQAIGNAGGTSANVNASIAVGVDQIATFPAPYITCLRTTTQCLAFVPATLVTSFNDYLTAGRHSLNWIATSGAASRATFFFQLDSRRQTGILGTIYN